MEFTFFTKPSQDRTFTRVRIQDTGAKRELTSYSTSGFYFVGKNSSSVDMLVKVFKRGYTSESLENAKTELTRCVSQGIGSIPEAIFVESSFSHKELRNFCYFLNAHPLLSILPVILDGTNLNEKDLGIHKKSKLVDEIIVLCEINEQHVQSKCKFLRNVKSKGISANSAKSDKPNANIISAGYMSKRLFDIVISSFALCLVSPLFLVIAMAIRFESPGSVFYISKRAGRGYRIFNFYKFRTMHMDADKNIDEYAHLNQYNVVNGKGPLFIKINNDPRVTKLGAFLRNTSLDELPQLINVLMGDMSLVGNRPLPLYEAATLTTDINAQRFLAPAGITGLWQIKKRGKGDMSAEERINLDIDYANKNSFFYDMWIMANTPSALMQKGNM